ncbi:hypothetical protein MASR1M65_25990 [Saprospiraceae bacterium]
MSLLYEKTFNTTDDRKTNFIIRTRPRGRIQKQQATHEAFHEGDIIMDYGKYINSMPVILSGNVRVLTQDEEGNEILLYYLSSNESCAMAYTCCMDAKQSEVKAVAGRRCNPGDDTSEGNG